MSLKDEKSDPLNFQKYNLIIALVTSGITKKNRDQTDWYLKFHVVPIK